MKPCNVLFVSPAFPINTFWNIKASARVLGARHAAIPLGLITVAAMLPSEWECRLVDCNVETLSDDELDWADLVMTGGMVMQRPDCRTIMRRAQERGKQVVVGGPDVTSQPEVYAEADFQVQGEAEAVMADFVAAWERGERQGTFVSPKFKVNVRTTPLPRFDLLRRHDYIYFSVQFSRGCPFMCEFCDIIELYGRTPRTKSIEQVLGELDALAATGYRGHLDFVDDNFIGNKKAVKELLPALAEWQAKNGYPFWLSTEASINLADDEELLGMMRAANFGLVFVGIESPDTDTLVATKKKQNTRRALSDSVQRIYSHGMMVIAGFIVGFDTEKGSIAEAMVDCVDATSIPICMVGLLTALPQTQLSRRLAIEGRLYPFEWSDAQLQQGGGDQCVLGLNFETRRPRREVLEDYRRILDTLYAPDQYFARVQQVIEQLPDSPPHYVDEYPGEPRRLGIGRHEWIVLGRLVLGAARCPGALWPVLRQLIWAIRHKPQVAFAVVTFASFYLHLGPFARKVRATILEQIAQIDRGEWQSPLPPAEEPTPVRRVRQRA